MKKLFILFCLLPVLFNSHLSFAQTKIDPVEITSTVPELTDFHKIIYPMWHDAYPAKDYDALKGFTPQIKESVESINKAKLPGILRDKETQWKNLLNELNVSAKNYNAAVVSGDNEAILTAAERLHSVYERMNRAIRPAIKEIDDYHQTLYIIYHKHYPDRKFDEIARLTSILVEKAEVIKTYPKDKLKKRLGENINKFDISAEKLYNATIILKDAVNIDDPEKKKEAVESVHKAYQDLDAVFH